MARTIFGTAFALLFFAYIKQGLHGVEVSHHETLNATVGQNINLPCIVKQQSNSNIHITQIEWSKKDAHNKSHNKRQTHRMVVHSASMGTHLIWPNVSIQLVNDDQMPNVSVPGRLIGSILHLGAVGQHDSGVYLCDITTFPDGSFRTERKLKVKGVEIKCDRNRSFTANPGENVTIHCSVNTASDARYNWTKDKRPLSQNDSLQLWRVGDAEAGSYTLTVQTGNDLLYAVFNITVLDRNTSLETGVEIKCDRNRSFTANPGENVTIHCSVNTASDARYNWTKDKRPLSQNDSLQLWRVGDAEAGSYTLTVQTGNDLLYAVFNITVLDRNTSLETGVEIKCDRNRSFTANPGENVTIHCSVNTASDARYNWTKDKRPLSQNDSLQLWRVGDAEAGSYTLTVQTGNYLLYAVFNITVLDRNTSLETESTPFNATEESWDQIDQTVTPSESTHMTSPSTAYADTSTWTMGVDTDMTAFKTDVTTSGVNHTISSGTVRSLTTEVNVSATHSSSDRFTSTDLLPANTTSTEKLTTHTVTNRPTVWSESNPRNASEWTTSVYGEPGASSTHEISNSDAEERATRAEMDPDKDTSAGDDAVQEDTSSEPAVVDHLQPQRWLIIFFIILALVVLVGFLYRKHTIKKKMDQPPPFKPPPPPIKYTSLIPQEFPVNGVMTTTV